MLSEYGLNEDLVVIEAYIAWLESQLYHQKTRPRHKYYTQFTKVHTQ